MSEKEKKLLKIVVCAVLSAECEIGDTWGARLENAGKTGDTSIWDEYIPAVMNAIIRRKNEKVRRENEKALQKWCNWFFRDFETP